MGWSFRKSKSLGKNSRLNIGKKSMGISTGVKGARISVNSKGRAGFSISAPGGFRYRKSFKIGGGGIVAGILSFFLTLGWWMVLLTIWALKWGCYLWFMICKWLYIGIRSLCIYIHTRELFSCLGKYLNLFTKTEQ